jgi:high mobility group AT-hook protein 2
MSASPQQEEVPDKSQEDFEEEPQVEETEGE